MQSLDTAAHLETLNVMNDWLSEPRPISRQNAAEAVFEDLRSAILTGRLPVDTRLPSEAKLAERYGVSRPIIREALRSLQTLGLTRSRTGSGSFVTSASQTDLSYGAYSARDLIEARPFIEVPAAGWAALRRSPAQIAALLDLCGAMESCTDAQDWTRLDSRFHSLIAEASGNALFMRLVGDAREAMRRQSELVNLRGNRREVSNREHRAIADAIASGSEDAAQTAMRAHLAAVEMLVADITAKPV